MNILPLNVLIAIFSSLLFASCGKNTGIISEVKVEVIYEDSISIRAIDIENDVLHFAGSMGKIGQLNTETNRVDTTTIIKDGKPPHFRSIARNGNQTFALSIGNPGLLYRWSDGFDDLELVYSEYGDSVFYDALQFWDTNNGIAFGDENKGCVSILITPDGGATWKRQPCSNLPLSIGGEGAFAASNTNIVTIDQTAWIATSKSRLLKSEDLGKNWEVYKIPVGTGKDASGVYSIDFYDKDLGIAFGGDYTAPKENIENKAVTLDGGGSWSVVASGEEPGYKSCVRFVPNSSGEQIVAVGFTGISISNDGGLSWTEISDEPFYTIEFMDKRTAFAAGKNRIAKLKFD
jgi:photosystem II stability/assembly factor-like uncharacterized protein